ncbi:hypothetical protein KKC97_08430 [bacterium]|nr:hypothetical protein [bacterium]MBU1637674.1 hypothetical protein [bacterium]
MKNQWWFVILLAAGLIFVFGCDSNTSTTDDPETLMTDQEALQALFLEDVDLEAPEVWGDEDPSGGGSLDEPITPLHWARLGHRTNTRVHVEIEGDSVATITRVHHFHGMFRIVTAVTDSGREYIDKEMHNEVIRKARAIRIRNTPRPRLNWRIVAVTPDVLNSIEPNPHTIYPESVEIYRNAGETMELLTSIDEPLHTWFRRHELPAVLPDEELVVFVNANREGAFGVLHPRVFRDGHGGRLPLHDDGEYPDAVAGDGILSGNFIVGPRPGVFLTGIDLIDFMTLHDSEAPYDAGGWGIPYRVVPAIEEGEG